MSFRDRPWHTAIPDVVAFAVGLGVAWVAGWSTADLIWSLWLSSLVVGYALIVWTVLEPALELTGLGWRHRDDVRGALSSGSSRQLVVALVVVVVIGALWIAFFTAHFGGFHFIQSLFLLDAWPLGPEYHTMNRATFAEVLHRYWGALPSAFLARRHAFAQRTFDRPKRGRMDDLMQSRMGAPYVQVFRMHVVIIALGAVHALGQDRFAVYAAIYALYFFPWRLLRRSTEPSERASTEQVRAPA